MCIVTGTQWREGGILPYSLHLLNFEPYYLFVADWSMGASGKGRDDMFSGSRC